MFKNHSFQIKMVKDSKAADNSADTDTAIGDRAYIIHETAKSVAKYAVCVIGTYVVLDTLRTVVENVTAK